MSTKKKKKKKRNSNQTSLYYLHEFSVPGDPSRHTGFQEIALRCCQGPRALMDYVSQTCTASSLIAFNQETTHLRKSSLLAAVWTIVCSVWAGDWALVCEALMR